MKRSFIVGAVVAVALVVGITIALAASGGGGSSSARAAAATHGGATVSAEQIGGSGNVLVDTNGQALQANDQEKNGMILCDGACLSFWTPLTIHGGTPKGAAP